MTLANEIVTNCLHFDEFKWPPPEYIKTHEKVRIIQSNMPFYGELFHFNPMI